MIDTFLFSNYDSQHHESYDFEKRCWDEFWSKNPKILDNINSHHQYIKTTSSVIPGDLSSITSQIDFWECRMIRAFKAFKEFWESFCMLNNIQLFVVCDNKSFDPSFINHLIHKYNLGLPLPYTFQGKYGTILETHTMQYAVLLQKDPIKYLNKTKGLLKELETIYDIMPGEKIEHDHRADNDAYTIAREFHVNISIISGKIQEKQVEHNHNNRY
jgi:hypothetical protein